MMLNRRKRTPDGVDYLKPIALRLMPKERIQAEVESKRLNKTKSAFAREAYLLGLPFLLKTPTPADTSTAVPSSGTDCPIRTASFSSKPTGKS